MLLSLLFSEIQIPTVVCGSSDIVELPDQLTSFCVWTDSEVAAWDQAGCNWDSGALIAEAPGVENEHQDRDGVVNNTGAGAVVAPTTGTHVSVQTTTDDDSGLISQLNTTNSATQHQQAQTPEANQRYGQSVIQNCNVAGVTSVATTRRLDRQLAARVKYLVHELRSIKTDVNETKDLKKLVVEMRSDMRAQQATWSSELRAFKSVMVNEMHTINAKVDGQGLILNRLIAANIEVHKLSTVDWAALARCLNGLKTTMSC